MNKIKKLKMSDVGKICVYCLAPSKKAKMKIKGVEVEYSKCTKCKKGIFTEEQATIAALKIDAHKLKKKYSKRPIEIGHSLGITFPKSLVEVFGLNKSKDVALIPKIKSRTIEIKIE